MGIIKLLPVELLASSGSGAGLAMVLALLVAAIIWNLGDLVPRPPGVELPHHSSARSSASASPTR